MTYKEIQNILQNICGKKHRVDSLGVLIRKEREQLEGVSAVKYDKLTVKSSQDNGTETRYVKSMDRINDLERHYDDLMEDIHNDEKRIFHLMQKLSPTEYEVILNRFLNGFSRPKIARIMNYTVDGVKDIQSRAIRKMSKS